MRASLFGLDDLAVSLGDGEIDMDLAVACCVGLTVCCRTVDLPLDRL